MFGLLDPKVVRHVGGVELGRERAECRLVRYLEAVSISNGYQQSESASVISVPHSTQRNCRVSTHLQNGLPHHLPTTPIPAIASEVPHHIGVCREAVLDGRGCVRRLCHHGAKGPAEIL